MKKNQLTTKSTALILGKSKSLMWITKKLLKSKSKGLTKEKQSQELVTHKDITIIGDLMWEKETQKKVTWDEAMEYAKNLRLGGYDDWRLPTIKELSEVATLCRGVSDKNWFNQTCQANYKAKGFTSNYYWSSTTVAGLSSIAWLVNFSYGSQCNAYKSISYYVRCVRSGQ